MALRMLSWQMVSRETLCSNPLKGQPWESWACSRQLLQVVVFRAKLGALLLKDSLRGLKNSSTTQMLVEQSCLVLRHLLSRLMAPAMPRLSIVQSRQIRTMLETDVVAQTAREFSGE